jgi:hypothetical protein
MKRTWLLSLLAVTALALAGSARAADAPTVIIHKPANGAEVDHRQEVSGKVSDPNADVWVVVHPMETSDFWIQPHVTVREDGSWKVIAYFGNADPAHKGKRFEVRAFANPSDKLTEGKSNSWPVAEAKSNVLEVNRR